MPTGIYKRKSRSDEYRHNIALARLGKKLSEETRKKISEAHKGKKRPPLTEEHKEKVRLNHWSKSIKAEEIKRKIGNKHLGRKRSEEVRKRMSEAAKKNPRRYWLGKKHPQTEESKKKISLALIKNGHHPPIQVGKNNWNWKGGISANPYPRYFNEKLKLNIRTRDNFICCLCGRTEREELEELNRVLCVNHIDFDKKNCTEQNLNTLCLRCNVKINRDRAYWTNYFAK